MERELLYQRIYNDLLHGIHDGSYPPGSRLPSEKELAEQYGVSRITSKKALEMLADQNLITRMPGKGSYVLESGGTTEEAVPGSLREKTMSGKGKLIGVILDGFGAAFGCDLVCGIEHECREKGYSMILRCTYGSMDEETKALDEMIELGVQGIILMCVQGESYNANVLRLSLEEFPIVLVDRELAGLPIPFVGTDNYHAARELMEVLIERGHTNICFLSHPFMQTTSVAARFSGYLDSQLEHNLPTNENMWIRDIDGMLPTLNEDEDSENENLKRILKFIEANPHVTGFFAVDQMIGVLVYKVLKKLGLENEKEVVFFDGIDERSDSNPVFGHVVQGEYLMGVVAVKCLQDRIQGKDVQKKHYIPYKVICGTEN